MTEGLPQQRTSTSMGRERPVHKAGEHIFRADGYCTCGKWDFVRSRRHRAAQERAGAFLRSDKPARPTVAKSSLDRVERNEGANGDR